MTIKKTSVLLALGQHIAQERLKQNLTQLALANRAGVAYSTLRKIESTGQGSMGHYADILLALGQLERLPFSTIAVPPEQQRALRKRARAAKVRADVIAPAQQAAARPSQKLGLDFPYDWSNPGISDTALIGKVLDKARFMDVSKIFAHYGHDRVGSAAADLGIDLTSGVLGSLMPGIQRGRASHTAHV
jgi:transcriptional regulator with XRE-family HTH domain